MDENRIKILQTSLIDLEEKKKRIEKEIDALSNEELYAKMESFIGKYFKYSDMSTTEIYKVLDINKKDKRLVVFSMSNHIMLIGWNWGNWNYGIVDYKTFTGKRLKEITKEEFDKEAKFIIEHEVMPYINK